MAELTQRELKLLAELPKPRQRTHFRASNVWIVEWLPDGERQTGLELHQWMKQRRVGWSAYRRCSSKQDFLLAIEEAATVSLREGLAPILHLEAHGDSVTHEGLVGPTPSGAMDRVTWDELIAPLQHLSVATRCNLVMFCAACTGIAALKALTRGPRAPALAVVGPDSVLSPSDLLIGAKEFYRRVLNADPLLQDIVDSASQEVGTVVFEYEPLTGMCYDAMVENLIVSMRPEELRRQRSRLCGRLMKETSLPSEEIERRMRTMPLAFPELQQKAWDEMFMIDLYPENQERFGLDVRKLTRQVIARAKEWYGERYSALK